MCQAGRLTYVKRGAFFLRPRLDGVPDILDAIQDLGGIAAPSQSRYASKGDYDGFREAFRGPARLLIRRKGGSPPDKLVQALSSPDAAQTFRLESTSDLYDAVDRAVKSREADKRQARRDKLDQEFYERVLAKRDCALTTQGLKVGDRFKVKRDQCAVTDLDPDSLEVTADCSPRFGRQRMPDGSPFNPNRCKVERANPDGFFDAPESVAEQKRRGEQAAQREEIRRRQAKPLTGRAVDTTGDLFDTSKASAPLFATRKNPSRTGVSPVSQMSQAGRLTYAKLTARRFGQHWIVRAGLRVLANGLTDAQLLRWAREHHYTCLMSK